MEMSEQIGDLLAALSLAQAEIRDAEKTRTNPGAGGAKYATLGDHWDAIREPLTKHGLCLSQWPGAVTDNSIEITSILGHKSGQWMKGTLLIPLPKETRGGGGGIKSDPQGMGIAITYGRRYHTSAIVGTCPNDDEDGGEPGSSKAVDKPVKQGPPTPSKATLVELEKAQRLLGVPFDFPETEADAQKWIAEYAPQVKAKRDAIAKKKAEAAKNGAAPAEVAA